MFDVKRVHCGSFSVQLLELATNVMEVSMRVVEQPDNILIAKDGYLKLADFGLSKRVAQGDVTFTMCGTPSYMAPEIHTCQGHSHSVDWCDRLDPYVGFVMSAGSFFPLLTPLLV